MVLESVIALSAILGWPHAPQPVEVRDVSRAVASMPGPRYRPVTAACMPVRRDTAALWACRLYTGSRRTIRLRLELRLWEDGSLQAYVVRFAS